MGSKRKTKLANRYSKALVKAFLSGTSSISEDKKSLIRKMVVDLGEIAKALSLDIDTSRFFQNPTIMLDSKERVLTSVLKTLDVNPIMTSFIFSVLRNGRIESLTQISEAFSSEVRSVLLVLAVTVTTARELNQVEKDDLIKSISSKMTSSSRNTELEFSWAVDKSILGGIVLEYDGRRYDSSILGKLSSIQDQIG